MRSPLRLHFSSLKDPSSLSCSSLFLTLFLMQARMLFGLFGHLGTLLAHRQHPRAFPKPVLRGVVVSQEQGPALGLAECHTMGPCPEPSAGPSSPGSYQIPPNLVSPANFLRVHLIASCRSLTEILNKTGPALSPAEHHWQHPQTSARIFGGTHTFIKAGQFSV